MPFNFKNNQFSAPITPRNKPFYYSSIRVQTDVVECLPCAGVNFPNVTFDPTENDPPPTGGGGDNVGPLPPVLPDPPFFPVDFDGPLYKVALFRDRSPVVLGNFQNVAGEPQTGIAALNLDGSVKTTFDVGTGFDNLSASIDGCSLDSDYSLGNIANFKIYAYYDGFTFNGNPSVGLNVTALNPNGSLAWTSALTGSNVNDLLISAYGLGDTTTPALWVFGNVGATGPSARLLRDGSIDPNYSNQTGKEGIYGTATNFGVLELFKNSPATSGNPQSALLTDTGAINTGLWSPAAQFTGALQLGNRAEATFNSAILISGGFTAFNGFTTNGFVCARLTDGVVDTVFSNKIKTAVSGGNTINAIRQTYNPLGFVIAGSFTSFMGQSHGRIARIDFEGNLDEGFLENIGTGFDDEVYDCVVDAYGYITCVGNFLNFNGVPKKYICRISPEGRVLGEPPPPFLPALDGAVFDMALDTTTDTFVLIGNFTDSDGTALNRLGRFDMNGKLDPAFDTTGGFATNGSTNRNCKVDVDSSGNIYCGHERHPFIGHAGIYSNLCFKTDPNGVYIWETSAQGNSCNDILVSDDQPLIAGQITTPSSSRQVLALIPDTGVYDPAFVTNVAGSAPVGLIKLATGKTLVFGGQLTDRYMNVVGILNTNGTTDISFDTGGTSNPFSGSGQPRSAIQLDNGSLLIGGLFTGYRGSLSNSLIAILLTGQPDTLTNPKLSPIFSTVVTIWGLARQSTGKIIVVGDFTTANGNTVGNICRLNKDGSYDSSFDVKAGTGFNSVAYCVKIDINDAIYVGGNFTQCNGLARPYVTKLQSDGTPI